MVRGTIAELALAQVNLIELNRAYTVLTHVDGEKRAALSYMPDEYAAFEAINANATTPETIGQALDPSLLPPLAEKAAQVARELFNEAKKLKRSDSGVAQRREAAAKASKIAKNAADPGIAGGTAPATGQTIGSAIEPVARPATGLATDRLTRPETGPAKGLETDPAVHPAACPVPIPAQTADVAPFAQVVDTGLDGLPLVAAPAPAAEDVASGFTPPVDDFGAEESGEKTVLRLITGTPGLIDTFLHWQSCLEIFTGDRLLDEQQMMVWSLLRLRLVATHRRDFILGEVSITSGRSYRRSRGLNT